jgi:hypothetical protein
VEAEEKKKEPQNKQYQNQQGAAEKERDFKKKSRTEINTFLHSSFYFTRDYEKQQSIQYAR